MASVTWQFTGAYFENCNCWDNSGKNGHYATIAWSNA